MSLTPMLRGSPLGIGRTIADYVKDELPTRATTLLSAQNTEDGSNLTLPPELSMADTYLPYRTAYPPHFPSVQVYVNGWSYRESNRRQVEYDTRVNLHTLMPGKSDDREMEHAIIAQALVDILEQATKLQGKKVDVLRLETGRTSEYVLDEDEPTPLLVTELDLYVLRQHFLYSPP